MSALSASAVSRALRVAGFRPSKPSAIDRLPALEVCAHGDVVSIVVDERRAQYRAEQVTEALTLRGYIASLRRSDERFAFVTVTGKATP